MKTCRVIAKQIGKPAEISEIENTYEALTDFLGDKIEYTDHPLFNVQIVTNRNSLKNRLPATILIPEYDTVICGNFLIVAHDEDGEMVSLTERQAEDLISDIKKREINNEKITVEEALYSMRNNQCKNENEME